ncbi:uncharacterized protein LOC132717592 [Ruditapes philippinarum]|uniref:uncharacterized protein LOC132717592 n=1 Tax=Ruditapes philippinarum TaxID=129788 RepID=UPI00295A9D6A|nr:uncharacterized protein LOC132717592 [Ruditapes philippinarum]
MLSVIKPSVEQSDSEANAECPAQMQMCEKDELMMIIAYCIEDHINEHDHRRVTLKEAQEHMYNSDSLVDQFHGIAYARILLNKAAGYINWQICESTSFSDGLFSMLDEDATTFLEKVKTFCEEQKAAGARKYLLRYLYRTFGFDILRAAFQSNDTSVNWVYSDEFKTKEPDRVDRFMACGDMYVRIKDYLKIPNEKPQADDVIQFVKNTNQTSLHGFIYLQMAIYWELTVSKCKRHADTVRRILVALSNTNKNFGNMAILHAMCINDLKQFNLDIQSETTEKDINIKCLVFQWISILFSVKQQPSCPLFNVLINLATQPSDFKVRKVKLYQLITSTNRF